MQHTRAGAVALALALGATSAYAGSFVELRSDLEDLSLANGGLLNGSPTAELDRFYIETTSATYLPGLDDTSRHPLLGGTGNVVASTINYRTFSGAVTTGTGTLTLLEWRVTDGLPLPDGAPQPSTE